VRAYGKDLELSCDVRGEVPDGLVGDPGRLRQVIVNLVGNAIKFTPRGEVVLHVERQSRTDRDVALHFAVSDTGIGIPHDKQQMIFNAFEQADTSTTRKYGGTGLGLAIASRLVRLMGGRMWLESDVGLGSTFHFTARFGLQLAAAVRPLRAERAALVDLPVLVVDDNATNRRILRDILTNWRMHPTTVADAREALVELRRSAGVHAPFPLVLVDAQMPDVDGFTLAAQIKAAPQLAGATIIMLSSAAEPGDSARCREVGVAAYLTKPIKQSELLDAILTALGTLVAPAAPPAVAGPPRAEAGPFGAAAERPLGTTHARPAPPLSSVEGLALSAVERRLHVLLAEDNLVNQRLVTRILEKRGHTVVVAGNGREALVALDQDAFDLVLMDVQMPELDGFETTAILRLREQHSDTHLPIIAMTAYAMKGDEERCREAGMDGYVAKPIDANKLFEVIATLIPLRVACPAPMADSDRVAPSKVG
jgi:CheY-like chemotaxis protein